MHLADDREGGVVVEAGGLEAVVLRRLHGADAPEPRRAARRCGRRRGRRARRGAARGWTTPGCPSTGCRWARPAAATSEPSAAQRVRMSLLFEPITSWSIGRPIRSAIQPEKMLPKLPGGHRERAAAEPGDGGDVVDDLGHHPGPVDRVHGRQAHRVAERRRRRTAPSRGPGSRRRCPRRRRCARWARRPWSSGGAARRSPGRPGGARRCRGGRGRRRPRWRPSPCRPRWPRRSWPAGRGAVSSWSNRRPTSWRATSLKASVGPQKSSSRWRSPSSTTGHTSGWSKVA